MLRLPSFTYLQPRTLRDALALKVDAGPDGMFVSGGTDLYPDTNPRHQEPNVVNSPTGIPVPVACDMRDAGCAVRPCTTLTDLSGQAPDPRHHDPLADA